MFSRWKEYWAIKKSGLFDPAYYLRNYSDVRDADVDPLAHFISNGWREGRNPGPFFDVHFYLSSNPDVAAAGVNPVAHYIQFGKKEGRQPISADARRNMQIIAEKDPAARRGLRRVVQILDFSVDPDGLFHVIQDALGMDRYHQCLNDLWRLENFFARGLSSPVKAPISQAAEMPGGFSESRRRKILFITSIFPAPYHGGGNRVLNFIKFLSQENDIYLFSAYYEAEDREALAFIEPYCKSIRLVSGWNFENNQKEINTWLAGEKMDVVHYEWPPSLGNYSPDFGRTHIFTYMETVSLRLQIDLQRCTPLSSEWLDKFLQFVQALRIELVDAALMDARIAVTTKDAEFLHNLYPYQEYTVLNHGINFDEFCITDVEPEPNSVVFVGNYRHYPNVDAMEFFFDKIWPEVCRAVPDARIYLVGPNAPESLARRGNNTSIIFTGGVPDLRPCIQKAAIGIAPLITGAGMRGKVIDYAALERTFVATSIATTDLVFQNGRDYLLADTPELFAQHVITLLQDRALARKMAAAAYETAISRYDHRKLTEFLTRLYDHIEGRAK